MPLLLVVLLHGLLQLPNRWHLAAVALPAVLISISVSLAMESNGEEAPPLKFVRYLQSHYQSGERASVFLILTECERSVQWYGPGVSIIARVRPLATIDPEPLASAKAIYMDDPTLALPPNWRLEKMALF